jgi:Tfp pilus assembly protein PilN
MKRASTQTQMRLGKGGAGPSRGGRRAPVARGDYMARVLVHRRVACAGSEFSRFNLFPYRQVEARRARRRVLVELVLAAAVGGGAAWGNERIDRHRATAMASRQAREVSVLREQLVQLAPRVAHADQFNALRERDARRRARMGGLNVRRRRIAELLESVGRIAPDYPEVMLRAMEIDAGQLLLDGAAADVQAFVRWLAALRKQGALAAPVVDVLERDGVHLRFSVRADTSAGSGGVGGAIPGGPGREFAGGARSKGAPRGPGGVAEDDPRELQMLDERDRRDDMSRDDMARDGHVAKGAAVGGT